VQLNSLSPQQRALLRAMIMQMLQQRMAEQQGGGASRGSSGGNIDYIKKAESLYKDGKRLYDFGSNIYNSFSQPAYSEATQAVWNQGAGEASQQAWNAGADAASGSSQAATNTPAAGPNYAGYTAAAASLYNSANRFRNTSRDEQQAYEASMAAPRAVAAFYTLGGSELAEGFARKQWGGTMKKFDKFMMNNPASPVFVPMQASRLWTSDKWKTEGNRLKKLEEMGIDVPKEFEGRMYQTRGLKKSELINPYLPKDFTGYTPQYGWVNNKFQDSRNEGDMRYEDLAPYATWAEKRSDWYKLSDNQRRAVTDAAQKAGAVREHHGTLDVDWSKVGDLDKIIGQAPAQAQQQQQPSRFVLKNGELIKRNTIPRVR